MSQGVNTYEFPDRFVWGAAAASYQIEGAKDADGKGPSVWDMFCERPGAVFDGHTGADACDHYHRYAEDVDHMADLGISAYRLSISWSRLFPAGTGALNEKGLDFYERLVDALLERNIVPYVTLFHWDYPLALFHRGGWLNRDSADWFAAYAETVAKRLSDRVTNYFTLNEPQVYLGHGHHDGHHAPGLTLPLSQVLLAGHHTLLGHGKAVQAMRAAAKKPLSLSYAPAAMPKLPQTDSAGDIDFARRAMFAVDRPNAWVNSWWMDPVIFGAYPEDGLEFYGADAPKIAPRDMETIGSPIDALGVNIYEGRTVAPDPNGSPVAVELGAPVGGPRSAFNWPITPDALYWGPRFLYERYKIPLLITENGVSGRDWVHRDGKVHDSHRIDFTCRYLRALHRALSEGVDVRGYFHWSILDNFEWAAGYRERFGLIYVDYETQVRVRKDSFDWYRQVIQTNGKHLAG